MRKARSRALVRTCGRVGVIGASRGSGGSAVWLDAVLAEQVAKVFEFAVQLLVFGDYWLAARADGQLLLQPQLVSEQLPLLVAQRRGGIEVPGVERGLLVVPDLGELFCGAGQGSGQLRLRICLLTVTAEYAQHPFPDQCMADAKLDQRLGGNALALAEQAQ